MNRNLVFIRLYYLFWLGAGGFIYPFISLFYKQQGLSGTQMGLLGTTGSIIGLVSAPLIGRISDNVSNPRRVLQVCLVGSALLFLILSQQSIFLWIAVIIAFEAVIDAAIYPLSDAQALNVADHQKEGYGSIRLWGSPLTGMIFDRFGAYPLYGIAMGGASITWLILLFTQNKPAEKKLESL